MHTDENTGRILLPIARAAIAQALGLTQTADESAPWLAENGACFVTLTQFGQLRGCIGSLHPYRPLLADVKGNAVASAMHDPRFHPLAADELAMTQIEISLLSPSEPLHYLSEEDALAQLRPGVDGIIFSFDGYRSTFLPQVWEQLPEPYEFMAHLKRKAGLRGDFWAPGVQLSRYTVSKFSEE